MQTDFDRRYIEKIVTAIYFVTQIIDDADPLKWRLRDIGIRLLRATGNECVLYLKEVDQLLNIGRVSSVISDMNANLIQKAVADCLNRHGGGLQLPTDFFTTDELPEQSESTKQSISVATPPKEPSTKTNVVSKGHVLKTDDTSERRDGIIDFLRNHSPATTTEIKKIIRGVSEKTIQRDLKWLIQKGLVTREGTRRWATYSLSQ